MKSSGSVQATFTFNEWYKSNKVIIFFQSTVVIMCATKVLGRLFILFEKCHIQPTSVIFL